MQHILQCPNCAQPFQVLAEQAGTHVHCPACQQIVAVPQQLPAGNQVDSAAETEKPQSAQGAGQQAASPRNICACPECQQPFGIVPEMLGTPVACPHCNATVTVQSEPEQELPTLPIEKPIKKKGGVQPKARPPKELPGSPAAASKSKSRWKGDKSADTELFAPGYLGEDRPHANGDGPSGKSRKNLTTSQFLVEDDRGENTELERKPVDHLLPPTFDVADPDSMQVKVFGDQQKVLLPDGQGGVKKVDSRLLRVKHGGQDFHLTNSTSAEKAQRRLIINIVTVAILMVLLVLIFFWLRKIV